MDAEKASLNYECNYNLFLAKRLFYDLKKIRDRQNTVKWLRLLMASEKSIAEMQLRNDIMHCLVLNLQEGRLRPPFHQPPPSTGTLNDLATLIPAKTDVTEEAQDILAELTHEKQKPMVNAKSPDGGAFLALQPVPHDGYFCYVAITTKK